MKSKVKRIITQEQRNLCNDIGSGSGSKSTGILEGFGSRGISKGSVSRSKSKGISKAYSLSTEERRASKRDHKHSTSSSFVVSETRPSKAQLAVSETRPSKSQHSSPSSFVGSEQASNILNKTNEMLQEKMDSYPEDIVNSSLSLRLHLEDEAISEIRGPDHPGQLRRKERRVTRRSLNKLKVLEADTGIVNLEVQVSLLQEQVTDFKRIKKERDAREKERDAQMVDLMKTIAILQERIH